MKDKSIQRRGTSIQSVERALSILELLAGEDGALHSSEVAAGLGLHVNTANNLLRTLWRRGFLGQDEDRRYRLGPQCVAVGCAADRWGTLRNLARPLLEELSVETGDSAFLAANADGKLFCVERTEGSGTVVVSAEQEWMEEFHCTASGKVLLAHMLASERKRVLGEGELPALTPKTITEPGTLAKELTRIVDVGFATSVDESREGASAVAVPVFAQSGRLIAALAQNFPSFFVTSGRIVFEERGSLLQRYAARLRRELR